MYDLLSETLISLIFTNWSGAEDHLPAAGEPWEHWGLAKPLSGCTCARVLLLRTVYGISPFSFLGVGLLPTCGFEPQ